MTFLHFRISVVSLVQMLPNSHLNTSCHRFLSSYNLGASHGFTNLCIYKELRRSARCSRLEKNRNNAIKEKINIKNSVLDYIRYKQLNWYSHVQRMDEERLPRKILECCPPGRKRKGIPGNSWVQKVTRMKENGINNMEWVDREEWKKKIKCKLWARKDVQTLRLCI